MKLIVFSFAASRSEVKLKLEVNGFNLNRCNNAYRVASITLNSKQMCAGGEEGKDSCSGDSGNFYGFKHILAAHKWNADFIR